jgi:ribose 5-phosphate isomerase A
LILYLHLFAEADGDVNDTEHYKQQAAEHALYYVQNGMVIGLGSGSTARYMLIGLSERLRDGRLRDVIGVPTSEATAELAHSLSIPLTTLDEHDQLDVALDGADEIDPQLNLIKGLGGALLREKIIAASARQFIVFADQRKLVARLGEHTPLPVEIIPIARALCVRRLAELGLEPTLRRADDGSAVYTDEGNLILDCSSTSFIDSAALNVAIKAIPGVVDHGLFLGIASVALIVGPSGITTMIRPV